MIESHMTDQERQEVREKITQQDMQSEGDWNGFDDAAIKELATSKNEHHEFFKNKQWEQGYFEAR